MNYFCATVAVTLLTVSAFASDPQTANDTEAKVNDARPPAPEVPTERAAGDGSLPILITGGPGAASAGSERFHFEIGFDRVGGPDAASPGDDTARAERVEVSVNEIDPAEAAETLKTILRDEASIESYTKTSQRAGTLTILLPSDGLRPHSLKSIVRLLDKEAPEEGQARWYFSLYSDQTVADPLAIDSMSGRGGSPSYGWPFHGDDPQLRRIIQAPIRKQGERRYLNVYEVSGARDLVEAARRLLVGSADAETRRDGAVPEITANDVMISGGMVYTERQRERAADTALGTSTAATPPSEEGSEAPPKDDEAYTRRVDVSVNKLDPAAAAEILREILREEGRVHVKSTTTSYKRNHTEGVLTIALPPDGLQHSSIVAIVHELDKEPPDEGKSRWYFSLYGDQPVADPLAVNSTSGGGSPLYGWPFGGDNPQLRRIIQASTRKQGERRYLNVYEVSGASESVEVARRLMAPRLEALSKQTALGTAPEQAGEPIRQTVPVRRADAAKLGETLEALLKHGLQAKPSPDGQAVELQFSPAAFHRSEDVVELAENLDQIPPPPGLTWWYFSVSGDDAPEVVRRLQDYSAPQGTKLSDVDRVRVNGPEGTQILDVYRAEGPRAAIASAQRLFPPKALFGSSVLHGTTYGPAGDVVPATGASAQSAAGWIPRDVELELLSNDDGDFWIQRTDDLKGAVERLRRLKNQPGVQEQSVEQLEQLIRQLNTQLWQLEQKVLRAEIDDLRSRLERIEKKFEERERRADDILESRLERLRSGGDTRAGVPGLSSGGSSRSSTGGARAGRPVTPALPAPEMPAQLAPRAMQRPSGPGSVVRPQDLVGYWQILRWGDDDDLQGKTAIIDETRLVVPGVKLAYQLDGNEIRMQAADDVDDHYRGIVRLTGDNLSIAVLESDGDGKDLPVDPTGRVPEEGVVYIAMERVVDVDVPFAGPAAPGRAPAAGTPQLEGVPLLHGFPIDASSRHNAIDRRLLELDLKEAELKVEAAETKYGELKQLAAEKTVSTRVVAEAQLELEQAQIDVERARLALERFDQREAAAERLRRSRREQDGPRVPDEKDGGQPPVAPQPGEPAETSGEAAASGERRLLELDLKEAQLKEAAAERKLADLARLAKSDAVPARQVAEAEDELAEARIGVERAKLAIERFDEQAKPESSPTAKTNGQIERVQSSTGHVWISVGSAVQLKPQTIFSVYGQGEANHPVGKVAPKGKIEVIELLDDRRAQGRILSQDTADPIKAGDLVGSPTSSSPQTDNARPTTSSQFQQDVLQASEVQPVVVLFWAPWCDVCRALRPQLERAVQETKGAVQLVTVDVDREFPLARTYGVESFPHVIGFRDGSPIEKFIGRTGEAKLQAWIEQLASPTVDEDKQERTEPEDQRPQKDDAGAVSMLAIER